MNNQEQATYITEYWQNEDDDSTIERNLLGLLSTNIESTHWQSKNSLQDKQMKLTKKVSCRNEDSQKSSLESPSTKKCAKHHFFSSIENLGTKDSPINVMQKTKPLAFGDYLKPTGNIIVKNQIETKLKEQSNFNKFNEQVNQRSQDKLQKTAAAFKIPPIKLTQADETLSTMATVATRQRISQLNFDYMTGYPKTSNKIIIPRLSHDTSKSNNTTINSNERSPLHQSLSNSPALSVLFQRAETEPSNSEPRSPLMPQISSKLLPKLKIKLVKSNSQVERLDILSPLLNSPQIDKLKTLRNGSTSERTKTPNKLPPLENYWESPRNSSHKKSSLSFSSNQKLFVNSKTERSKFAENHNTLEASVFKMAAIGHLSKQ